MLVDRLIPSTGYRANEYRIASRKSLAKSKQVGGTADVSLAPSGERSALAEALTDSMKGVVV